MLLLAWVPIKDIAVSNSLLIVDAKCRSNAECLFEGQDIFLDISITNNQKTEIGFPLSFLRKTGPVIRLIDTHTKADNYLKNNLADLDLQRKFTFIRPGESVELEWVVTGDELRAFGGRFVDVSAEITVMAKVQLSGKLLDFRGVHTLHIVSKGKE